MPIIFQNDFEQTVSPFGWDATSTSGGTVQVNSEHPHHGAYNLFCTYDAGVDNSHACVIKNIPGATFHDHLFARAMNCIINIGPPNSGVRRHLMIGFYELTVGNLIAACGVVNDAGTLKWQIRYRHAGAFQSAYGRTPTLNKPCCIEFEVLQSTEGIADGVARMWIDGVLELEIIGIDNDDRAMNCVAFGFVNSASQVGQYFWADCFALSTERIGCEPPRGCFIATAAYGTPLAQEISVLRQFRDNFMNITGIGRKLAETYYRISPPIARAIAQHNTLRAIVRAILKPIVQLLQK